MFPRMKALRSAAARRLWEGPSSEGRWPAILSEFLFYLAGVLGVVVGVLLLERIVAGPHATAGTGYARVDSAFDFDRLRRKQYGARATSLLRHRGRSTLPVLQDVIHEYRQLRDAGEQFIPVASIVGSVDGASQLFDGNFRPISDRARARLGSVLVAMRQDKPLPPIDVWAWCGQYYVLDGHHRVAAARALGRDYIGAHVVEVGRGSITARPPTTVPTAPDCRSVAVAARSG
jgi:hypothetical protein